MVGIPWVHLVGAYLLLGSVISGLGLIAKIRWSGYDKPIFPNSKTKVWFAIGIVLGVFFWPVALLGIAAPALIRFLFTDRYLGAVPIFRLAIVSIPMAALPLDGVMRARAQNKFMFRVSVLKVVLTAPLAWAGLRLFGPIGALGGWICAEEACRMILLHRAARLFGTTIFGALPREVWVQAAGAAIAAPPAALALHFAGGPLLVQLFITGLIFAIVYLAVLRALGILPPLRTWIPARRPELLSIRDAA